MKPIWHIVKQQINHHWRLHWLLIIQALILMAGTIGGILLLEYQLDMLEDHQEISLHQAKQTEQLVNRTLNNTVELHITANNFYHQLHLYGYELHLLSIDPDWEIVDFIQTINNLQIIQVKLKRLLLNSRLMRAELVNIENSLLILLTISDEVIALKKIESVAEIDYLYVETQQPIQEISASLVNIQRRMISHSKGVYQETRSAVKQNLNSIEASTKAIDRIEYNTIILLVILVGVITCLQLVFSSLFHYRVQLLVDYSNKIAGNIHEQQPILAVDNTGKLAKNLYKMSEYLQKNRLEIEQFNRTLEANIHQRTVELQQTNEELQATNEELLSTNDELYSALDNIVLAERQLKEEINEHKHTQVLLKAAMTEADEARLHAEKSSKAKSEFLANMSHEIRTPMNAILGFTEILTNRLTDPQHLHYLYTITTSGKTLLHLINDVLDLSKVEAGKFVLEYLPVNPKIIFQDLHDMFVDKIAAKKLKFSIEIDKNLPFMLMLDETRFRQVLLNLLSNALKFTEVGYIKVIVQSELLDSNHVRLRMQVQDTGMGIAENQQDIIFEAFEQQDGQSHAKFGGTGLGLTITKRLVEMMGGDISVTSQPHVGSTFTVILPSVEIADNTLSSDDSETNLLDLSQIHFAPATVLVADDVMLNREVIHTYLSLYKDLTLLDAEDGGEAINIAREKRPDIILMDIKMPNMNGDEALSILKQHAETADIPVIAITASMFKRNDSHVVFFDGYLVKPVQQQQLVESLMQFLSYSWLETEATLNTQSPSAALAMTNNPHNIRQLINHLEQEVWIEWETHNQADFFDMNGITQLSQRLQILADEYECVVLQEWANKLHTQVNLFDMSQLPATLGEFPEVIATLKQKLAALS